MRALAERHRCWPSRRRFARAERGRLQRRFRPLNTGVSLCGTVDLLASLAETLQFRRRTWVVDIDQAGKSMSANKLVD